MDLTGLTPQQLRKAADIKERILSLQSELSQLLGVASGQSNAAASFRRTRKAGGGRRNTAAKTKQAPQGPQPGGKPKRRKLSAAGRAAIVAATKARWARVKAAGKTNL